MNQTGATALSWATGKLTTDAHAPTISPNDDKLFTAILFVIHNILDPMTICLGLVGNTLAFLVLMQPQYRNQTTCFYMRILAIFDTSIIILKNVPVSCPLNTHRLISG